MALNSRLKVQNSKIAEWQIKLIHTLKSKLNMDDEQYRLRLSNWWVRTSKDLTYQEANEFIAELEDEAVAKGVWIKRSEFKIQSSTRFNELAGRKGMASPKELRMIEAIWKDVSYTHDVTKRQSALRKFLFRIAGVQDLRFLTSRDAKKVIHALKNMKDRRWR